MTPKEAFDQTIGRASDLLCLYDLLVKNPPTGIPVHARSDILRSAIVLSVSALDRYAHERAIKGFVGALRSRPLDKTQEGFEIPAHTALRIAQLVSSARGSERQVRPANEIRKQVQDLLHKRPFQSWGEIEFAFELIGITGLAGRLQNVMRVGDINSTKKRLNQIIDRRNKIVHEGDLERHERGGNVNMHEIKRAFVDEAITFLKDIVRHLDSIT